MVSFFGGFFSTDYCLKKYKKSNILPKCLNLESSTSLLGEFLTCFEFVILYHPRMQQGKADALSRRSYMELQPGETAFEIQKQIVLGLDRP